jgi:hypothetical protein
VTAYTFFQLDEKVRSRLRLPAVPLPVRRGQERRIFGGDEVHFDLLLDELGGFLAEHPAERSRYRATAAVLAHVTGVELATEGFAPNAAHAFEVGLAADPGNVALRGDYVLALTSLGRHAEALAECDRLMRDPGAARSPHVRVFAARLCREVGQYERGYRLLKSLVPLVPEDNGFWDLLADLEEKAGHGPASPRVPESQEAAPSPAGLRPPQPAAAAPSPALRFCTSCGTAIQPQWRFCGRCGSSIA